MSEYGFNDEKDKVEIISKQTDLEGALAFLQVLIMVKQILEDIGTSSSAFNTNFLDGLNDDMNSLKQWITETFNYTFQ